MELFGWTFIIIVHRRLKWLFLELGLFWCLGQRRVNHTPLHVGKFPSGIFLWTPHIWSKYFSDHMISASNERWIIVHPHVHVFKYVPHQDITQRSPYGNSRQLQKKHTKRLADVFKEEKEANGFYMLPSSTHRKLWREQTSGGKNLTSWFRRHLAGWRHTLARLHGLSKLTV